MAEASRDLVPVAGTPAPDLPRPHKAAIVLAALEPDVAAAIVEEMSDADLAVFARAFGELAAVPAATIDAVALEFAEAVGRAFGRLDAGAAEARRVLGLISGEKRADRVFAGLSGPAGPSVWDRLEKLPVEPLARWLGAQRPPVAAAVLARLSRERAAELLDALDGDLAERLLLEIAARPNPGEEALAALGEALEEDLIAPLLAAPDKSKAGALVGEIVNCLSAARRDAALAALDGADDAVAAAARKAVLTFEDLATRLPPSAPPALIREAPREVLLPALKYGETAVPATVEFLFANISQRMAEQIREDLAGMATPSDAEGEKALRAFMAKVRALAASGAIALKPPSDTD